MASRFEEMERNVAKLLQERTVLLRRVDDAEKEARAATARAERLERSTKSEGAESKRRTADLAARVGKSEQNLLKVALQSEKAAADLLQKVGQKLQQLEGRLGDFLGLDGDDRAALRRTADTFSGAGGGAKAGAGAGARLGGAFGPGGAALGGLLGGIAGGVAGGVVGSDLEPKRRAAGAQRVGLRNQAFREDQAAAARVADAQAALDRRDERARLRAELEAEQRKTLLGQGDPRATARLKQALRRAR